MVDLNNGGKRRDSRLSGPKTFKVAGRGHRERNKREKMDGLTEPSDWIHE
jgi:hypothetical protein